MSLSVGFLEDPGALRVPDVVGGVCAHVRAYKCMYTSAHMYVESRGLS